MKRPGGEAIAAGLAGLAVVVAGVWGQRAALDDATAEDGAIFLASVDFFAEGPNRLVVDNLSNGQKTVLVDEDGVIPGAPAWSPDGLWLVWYEIRDAGEGSVVVIWNRRNGSRREFDVPVNGLNRLAWSPDSKLFASAGDPLRVWDTSGRLVATSPVNDDRQTSHLAVPALPWSEDGSQLIYGLGTRVVHYDRAANTVVAWSPEDLGLPVSEVGYSPIGWASDAAIVVFSRSEPRIFEVNLSSRAVRELDQPPAGALPGRDRVLGVARERVPAGNAVSGDTADGRGTFAAAASPMEMVEGRARLFLEVGGAFAEIPIETRDPTFRNISVVLVGDWPRTGGEMRPSLR